MAVENDNLLCETALVVLCIRTHPLPQSPFTETPDSSIIDQGPDPKDTTQTVSVTGKTCIRIHVLNTEAFLKHWIHKSKITRWVRSCRTTVHKNSMKLISSFFTLSVNCWQTAAYLMRHFCSLTQSLSWGELVLCFYLTPFLKAKLA